MVVPFLNFLTPCICLIALQFIGDESAFRDKHFDFFTTAKSQKISEIQNFEIFLRNFQKKSNISETVRVTEIS